MNANYKRWRMLFLFCLGLFTGTALCMKWMEGDFVQDGKPFDIIGLEITYSQEEVKAILSGLDEHVRYLLNSHLFFDFAFMAGVYPGIAALCMMGRNKASAPVVRRALLLLAFLQLLAWACDIAENDFLLEWLKKPSPVDDFGTYHAVVYTKWAVALAGAVAGIITSLRRREKSEASFS